MDSALSRRVTRLIAFLDLILGIFAVLLGSGYVIWLDFTNFIDGYLKWKLWILWLPLAFGFAFQSLQLYAAAKLIQEAKSGCQIKKALDIAELWSVFNAIFALSLVWIFVTLQSWSVLGVCLFIRLFLGGVVYWFIYELQAKKTTASQRENSSSDNSDPDHSPGTKGGIVIED